MKRFCLLMAGLAVVLALVPASPTLAAVVNANVTKDAEIYDYNSTLNNGTGTVIRILKPSGAYYGLLEWSLASVPGGAVVNTATLNLHGFNNLSQKPNIYRITNNSWGETTVNWGNRPSYTTTNMISWDPGYNTSGWYQINVTNLVKDAIAAGHNVVGFFFSGTVYDQCFFMDTKEKSDGAYKSYIAIDYSAAPFSFVHITDLHVAASASAGDYDLDGVAFGQVIAGINGLSPKPAFVVATGDICHAGDWSSAQYPDVIQRLFPNTALTNPAAGAYYADAARTIPVYFVTGNHDYRETNVPPTSDYTPDYYPSQMGPLGDYVIDKGSAVIVGLNSGYDQTRTGSVMKPEGSGLSNAQMAWLHNQWVAAGSKKKIVFMHHPAVADTGTLWNGQINSDPPQNRADGAICENRTWFLNQCDSFSVNVVLTGHEHQYVDCDRNGANWTSGTRYIQTAEGFRGCYRTVTVDGGVSVSAPQRFNVVTVFSDVPLSYWGYPYIMYLYERGVVSGYPDGTFKPEDNVTRAQLATMMKRALNLPDYTGGLTDYPDVPPTHWAYPYIMSAKQNNIMGGYPDGRFGPEDIALRSQVSCVISKAKGWTYYGGLTDFPDVPPTHWAYSYIMCCKQEGIVSGYPDGTFGPEKPVTRAQSATMIARMMQWTAKSAITNEKPALPPKLPTVTQLILCAPNPLTQHANISYQLASPGNVSLKVYNISGQLVKTLANETKPAGNHSVRWDGRDASGQKVAAGVYLYRIDAGSYSAVKKLTVIR